jgi:hypothetical protein
MVWMEIDKDYYDAACSRFKKECDMPLFNNNPATQTRLL